VSENSHDGMKKCTKCGEWKPATAEFFNRDKARTDGLRSLCIECVREYYQENKDRFLERLSEYRQKNKDRVREYNREYRQKNKEEIAEYQREYYQENKDRFLERLSEYRQTPVGRLSESIYRLRRKTGATIYVRDMTDEEKETLANQYVAIRTLEKTEKELLAASGKKRCSKCDRVLDYDCFHKSNDGYAGLNAYCKACDAKYNRKYRQQNKYKIKEYSREYYEKNKDYYREYNRKHRQNKKNKK